MPGYTYEIMKATSEGFSNEEVAEWLEIDNSTGAIHTRKHPIPEKVKLIRLYISMRKGKREVPVELIINVVDTADSAPFFSKGSYKAVTSEDTRVGSRLLQVKAEAESALKYSLEILKGPKDVLEIDYEGFIRNKARLDFESFRAISGRVHVVDADGNRAVTNFSLILIDANDNRPVFVNGSVFTAQIDESAKVTVLVRDVNDNAPVIHNSDLTHLTVSEDTPIGTTVTVISASDLDEGLFPFTCFFQYSAYFTGGKQEIVLKVNHTLFRVADEGKLVVAEKLNGYAGERLCSTIIARDTGEPPRTTTYPFCVTVYPASNSHFSPLIVFPKQNSIHYFDENVQYDELLRIKLLEEEHMGVVSYKFDETFKKDWENFSLNTSGSLSAKEPFDFEKKPVHELKILACRQANCSSVHVFISVNDRNDNCPIFPRQQFILFLKDFHLSVLENDRSPVPRQIGRIPAAMDGDFHADNTKVILAGNLKLLSNATSLTAMIDRCRQNLNYTVVLAHFLDDDGSFVEVDTALRRLVLSNSTARRELRNAYGLREKLPLTMSGVMALETVILAVLIAVFILLILCICLYCRQRRSYGRKLRQIATQAVVHNVSLSRQPTQKVNPYYATDVAPTTPRVMAPPPPLQSTEL
ncbi:hypothetical protein OESDEN_05853 [Oesophagostomum dentatum]|uniref:Cadherin domain-containing protein n=1 Tax=Oesophagostomum dentatum TaxID=61180 RepID=A0A0B1TEJ4_OESDE|nr:hypothetical protein OESDEN_05853 [Oesophagostomum dentatum]